MLSVAKRFWCLNLMCWQKEAEDLVYFILLKFHTSSLPEKSPCAYTFKTVSLQKETNILVLFHRPRNWDMQKVTKTLRSWDRWAKGCAFGYYKIQEEIFNYFHCGKNSKCLKKRKAPSRCKKITKQMFFMFRYVVMAKKIYCALTLLYIILYPNSHHECYICGRPQWFSLLCGIFTPVFRGFIVSFPKLLRKFSHPSTLLDLLDHCAALPACAKSLCLL